MTNKSFRRIDKKHANSNHNDQSKFRAFAIAITLTFFVIAAFLGRWQIIDHQKFVIQAGARQLRTFQAAQRGDILAQDGSVLSYSEPRFDIYVFKDEKQGLIAAENSGRQTRREFVDKVSEKLNISPEDLEKKLNVDSKWIKIAEAAHKDVRDQLLTIPTDKNTKVYLDGINYEETSVRVYPEGDLASQVLGFVGKDDFGNYIGRSGLEQYFEGVLKPQQGISSAETDSNQTIIALGDNQFKDARPGATLVTTINKNIQAKVQQHLESAVNKFGAKSGSVIVMDPRTGEILALANYPSYDPNSYKSVTDITQFKNIAITSPYEIGSIGKIFTMTAAVDQGKVEPNTVVINGHKGCQEIIEGRIICTYDKKPKGKLTATEAMIDSDNLALFSTANLIGSETLANYLEKFGMGKRTNVMLSGEDAGYIKSGKEWNEADLATYSYGHSYYQTPLQAITGVAALANKGKIMEPLIVTEQLEADGSTRKYTPRVATQVVSEKTCETMADILYPVFIKNTPESIYQPLRKYRIAMKSGTALIPFSALKEPIDKPGYSNAVNSTYVGYDASSKNTFIMLANLSEPSIGQSLSFYNARYLWLDIFMDIKDELGVPTVY